MSRHFQRSKKREGGRQVSLLLPYFVPPSSSKPAHLLGDILGQSATVSFAGHFSGRLSGLKRGRHCLWRWRGELQILALEIRLGPT